MNDQAQQRIELLERKVRKLEALAVLNLESIMLLSTALMNAPDLTIAARDQVREAFNGIQPQIDMLKELGEMEIDDIEY